MYMEAFYKDYKKLSIAANVCAIFCTVHLLNRYRFIEVVTRIKNVPLR